MKKLLSFLLCAASMSVNVAQGQQAYFTNPVIQGDMADPSILRIGETYYVTGTSSEWAPIHPIFASSDLVNWKQTGHVFEQKPDWVKSSFWAPEWFHHKGKVYVYYTARKELDNISCIGVAIADSPTGPFKDRGPVVEFGKEAIDPFILEENGQLYMSWKAYGLDNRPIELLACKLSDDGLKLVGEPFTLLRDDERQGMEAQQWFKKDGYYYLIYATNSCCGPQSDYAVAAARAKKLEGPYEKCPANPILHGGKEVLSIGHGTLTDTPDGRMYFLCHAYSQGAGFYQGRQAHLVEMRIGGDHWPHFVTGEYASLTQPMPFAETAQMPIPEFSDNFSSTALRHEWTWNFPFSDLKAVLKGGKLALSGNPKPGIQTGTALCLRPTAPNYTLSTAVLNQNKSRKGLTLYGDADNLLIYGCVGDRLKVDIIRDGKEHSLADLPLPAAPLHLRMRVTDGTDCALDWSEDGRTWNELRVDIPQESTRSLVRWDRVARPGLYHQGEADAPAMFEYGSLQPKRD